MRGNLGLSGQMAAQEAMTVVKNHVGDITKPPGQPQLTTLWLLWFIVQVPVADLGISLSIEERSKTSIVRLQDLPKLMDYTRSNT